MSDTARPDAAHDLRLLPMAALGWLGALVGVRTDAVVGTLLVLVAGVATALAGARLRRPPRGRHRGRTPGRAAATVLLTGAVVGVITGAAALRAETRSAAVEPHLRQSAVVTVRIDSEPRSIGQGRLLLRGTWVAADAAAPGSVGPRRPVPVTLLVDGSWHQVVVGSRVTAPVRIAATDPGDASAALLVGDGAPAPLARPPPVAAVVASLRAGLLAACADLDEQARGLVPGIALGDDRELPATLAEDLRTVSLTHVTAVSGAHVALVLGIAMALLVWLPRPWRAVMGALVLAALVVLVHPSASVLRSATMGAVLLVGLLLARPRTALPALWAGVVVLLLHDPWLAGSFGFVLSVSATAGLLLGSGPLTQRWSRYLPRPLAAALAIPVAAQLACLPALALLQPTLPVHGVLANALAAPAVPPATVLGLTATLVAPFAPGLAAQLASWAGVATAWIASVATWCAGLPAASVPWWVAGLVILLGVLVVVMVRRRRARRPAGAPAPAGRGAG